MAVKRSDIEARHPGQSTTIRSAKGKKAIHACNELLAFVRDLSECDDVPPGIRREARYLIACYSQATKAGLGSNLKLGQTGTLVSLIDRTMSKEECSLHQAAKVAVEKLKLAIDVPRAEQIYRQFRRRTI